MDNRKRFEVRPIADAARTRTEDAIATYDTIEAASAVALREKHRFPHGLAVHDENDDSLLLYYIK